MLFNPNHTLNWSHDLSALSWQIDLAPCGCRQQKAGCLTRQHQNLPPPLTMSRHNSKLSFILTSIKMLSSEPSPGEHQVQMILTVVMMATSNKTMVLLSFEHFFLDDKTYLAVRSDGSRWRKVGRVWWRSFPSPPSSLPPPSSPIGQCRRQPSIPQRSEGGEKAGNSIVGASHTFVFLIFGKWIFSCACFVFLLGSPEITQFTSIKGYGCRHPCFLWLC